MTTKCFDDGNECAFKDEWHTPTTECLQDVYKWYSQYPYNLISNSAPPAPMKRLF